MNPTVPRITALPDMDGNQGFLLVVPLSTTFELRLKAQVAREDLFWSAKPAGWWIPVDYLDKVIALSKDYFGYVQVVSPEGKAHQFHGRDAVA